MKPIRISLTVFLLVCEISQLVAQDYIMPYNSSFEVSTDSGMVYDDGGPNAKVFLNPQDTLYLYPASSGKYLQLEFLDLELSGGFFNCYAGIGTEGTILFSGSEFSKAIHSTHSSGAITLAMGGSLSGNGFEARISTLEAIPQTDISIWADTTNLSAL